MATNLDRAVVAAALLLTDDIDATHAYAVVAVDRVTGDNVVAVSRATDEALLRATLREVGANRIPANHPGLVEARQELRQGVRVSARREGGQ